jgi:hypothetical protein
MTHIAIQEALNGKVVNWMEKLTDAGRHERRRSAFSCSSSPLHVEGLPSLLSGMCFSAMTGLVVKTIRALMFMEDPVHAGENACAIARNLENVATLGVL